MRKKLILLFVCLFATTYLFPKNLKVNVNYLLFSIPNETNYIELQCLIFGNTIQYIVNQENKYQGQINLEVVFETEDSLFIPINKKYTFFSNAYSDTLLSTKDDIYNVFRIPIANGEYTMKIILSDANNHLDSPLSYESNIVINFNREIVSFSDIQLMGNLSYTEKSNKFSKHNIDFIPYFSNFYPEYINKLIFMNEIYHTDKINNEQDTLIYKSYISQYENESPISDKYLRQQKFKKTDNYILLHSFDIDSLPSGNYSLNIAVFTINDSLIASRNLFFQRSNPSMDKERPLIADKIPLDTLYLYLDYIYVVANSQEKEFIRKSKQYTYEELDGFFSIFWSKRNPDNPLEAWYEYYEKVVIVNNSYSTLAIPGYKTDRGYVFLKYGVPNEIEKFPFTQQYYPYEIWYYYNAADQYNINFIFYNRDLVTNFYQLIHSTARDEPYDPRWKLKLKAKDSLPIGIEETE